MFFLKIFDDQEQELTAGTNGRGIDVRGVFEDAFNYMKNGTLIRQVVNKINEIDFNRSSDRHTFGDIYEQIKANSYNLDIKKPNIVDPGHGDPEELLAEYKELLTSVAGPREKLKQELMVALENEADAGRKTA